MSFFDSLSKGLSSFTDGLGLTSSKIDTGKLAGFNAQSDTLSDMFSKGLGNTTGYSDLLKSTNDLGNSLGSGSASGLFDDIFGKDSSMMDNVTKTYDIFNNIKSNNQNDEQFKLFKDAYNTDKGLKLHARDLNTIALQNADTRRKNLTDQMQGKGTQNRQYKAIPDYA